MDDFKIENTRLLDKMHSIDQQSLGMVQQNDASSVSFKDYFVKSLDSVNDIQSKAQDMKAKYVAEDPNVSLSSVMIQMQKAEISLSALSAVKDKLVEGFKSILNMTV